jgi:hypothetical protein
MRRSSTRDRRAIGAAATQASQHQLRRQLEVGNYDLSADLHASSTRASAHWDTSADGQSGYNFDQPTHQGVNRQRYGYDPVFQVSTQDPDAPPTTAEMYQILLNADSEEQIAVLAKDYLRRKQRSRGAFSSEWCQLSAIQPGQTGCSAEKSLLADDANSGELDGVSSRSSWDQMLEAAQTVHGAGGDADDAP